MKHKLISILLIFSCLVFVCCGSDDESLPVTQANPSVFDLNSLFAEEQFVLAFGMDWQDYIKSGILDDLYKMGDLIFSSVMKTDMNFEDEIKTTLGKFNIDLEKDIQTINFVMKMGDIKTPLIIIHITGNFENKSSGIISGLEELSSLRFSKEQVGENKIYTGPENTAITFPDSRSIMISSDQNSLLSGIGLLQKNDNNTTTPNHGLARVLQKLNARKTYWTILKIPESLQEELGEYGQQAGMSTIYNMDYIYADGLLAGKNSSSTLKFYSRDPEKIESMSNLIKGYIQMGKGMYSEYPAMNQIYDNATFDLDKENGVFSIEMKYDFDAYWAESKKMINAMLPMINDLHSY